MTQAPTPRGLRSLTADALRPGDRLLSLAGVTYPQRVDIDAEPTLVCQSRPIAEGPVPGEPTAEVITSHGTIYADPDSPAVVIRDVVISPQTVLLISRRSSLHATLLGMGTQFIRRTPLLGDGFIRSVTPLDWITAPLIVLDGSLPTGALDTLRTRSDLVERDRVIMVGDDPDDYRLENRARVARTSTVAVLPWDRDALVDTFLQATGRAATGATGFFQDHTALEAPPTDRQ